MTKRFDLPNHQSYLPALTSWWMAPQLMAFRACALWLEELNGRSYCDQQARRLITAQTDQAIGALLHMQSQMMHGTKLAQGEEASEDSAGAKPNARRSA